MPSTLHPRAPSAPNPGTLNQTLSVTTLQMDVEPLEDDVEVILFFHRCSRMFFEITARIGMILVWFCRSHQILIKGKN